MSIWKILCPFGILYGRLVYFVVIWYIFPHFGMLYLEEYGIKMANYYFTKLKF
jgi:hypothetical protein